MGRIAVSFMYAGAAEAPLVLRVQKDAQRERARCRKELTAAKKEAPFMGNRSGHGYGTSAPTRLRHCLYFLQQPETHAFSLYHDYTGEALGSMDITVRTGRWRDDAEEMMVRRGERVAQMVASKINTGETVDPKDRVVVTCFLLR